MIKFIFHKILGWKINGYSKLPVKCVLIACPHTHWIDLFLGFAIRNSIGEDIKFIGKKELFIFPLNIFLRNLGGIPVVRNSKTNTVDQISNLIKSKREFKLAISPEGTRKKVYKWKSRNDYITFDTFKLNRFSIYSIGQVALNPTTNELIHDLTDLISNDVRFESLKIGSSFGTR